jgi:hypothetical protein
MQVEGVIDYPGVGIDQVFTMLINPEFQRRKCAATGATAYDVAISANGTHTVIVCNRTLPTDGLPDFVRPLVGSGLVLVETIDWGPANERGRTGAVELAFPGQPLRMTGALTMIETADGTSATLNAQLKASVPLLGARIEKACAPLVQQALRIEQEVGTEWLAEPH